MGGHYYLRKWIESPNVCVRTQPQTTGNRLNHVNDAIAYAVTLVCLSWSMVLQSGVPAYQIGFGGVGEGMSRQHRCCYPKAQNHARYDRSIVCEAKSRVVPLGTAPTVVLVVSPN